MTDFQLIEGIKQNDEHTWRYICRGMRLGFITLIKRTLPTVKVTDDDIDDIFQESLVLLMDNVKSGRVAAIKDEKGLFSYLVQVGKLKVCNLQRKKRPLYSDNMVTFSQNPHNIDENGAEITIDEKQQPRTGVP